MNCSNSARRERDDDKQRVEEGWLHPQCTSIAAYLSENPHASTSDDCCGRGGGNWKQQHAQQHAAARSNNMSTREGAVPAGVRLSPHLLAVAQQVASTPLSQQPFLQPINSATMRAAR